MIQPRFASSPEMNLVRSYKRMKWYTRLGIWGSLASLVPLLLFLITCRPPDPTSQETTGPQSPIVNAKGSVSITYQTTDVTNVINALRQGSTNTVRQAVEETLRQMDTNRVRVEILTKQLEEQRDLGETYRQKLEQTTKQLTEALVTVDTLRSNLATIAQFSQLSPTDQERVNKTVASAQKAKSVAHIGSLRVGTLIIGTPPAPKITTNKSGSDSSK